MTFVEFHCGTGFRLLLLRLRVRVRVDAFLSEAREPRFFDREEDVAAYTRDLLALHDDPSNKVRPPATRI